MRLQIISDFHVDVTPGFIPKLAPGADVVVVAGDVCEGPADGMAFLREHIPAPTPIVYVAGNHEYYEHGIEDERAAAPAHARAHGITWLDDTSAVIAGVRFLGATLWTDFCLHGAANQPFALLAAQRGMNDFRLIRSSGPGRLLTAQMVVDLHRLSREFIDATLSEPFDGPTVVVTHHAPHRGSVAERFRGNPINPAFVSDLSRLISDRQPTLWVHGHNHDSFDYRVGDTRVVCNPKGYGRENGEFDPQLVVEV